MRGLICVLIVSAVAACATAQGYENMVETWLGSPEVDLVSQWGAPDGVYDAGNGVRVITYEDQRSGTYSVPHTNTAYSYGAYGTSSTTYTTYATQSYNVSCETNFTITNATVTAYSFKGNGCLARE